MSRFVHVDYPTQHGGVVRVERAVRTLRGLHFGNALVSLFAAVGEPVRRAAAALAGAYAAGAERRRQAREDRKLWELALSDARVMADLSRAMANEAVRDIRRYY